ncbi:MAG TPA: helix-turn-helix transcriptional regulator [Roseiflexaceae bacterium]|nr:helix-turn-helix transcriptional regulator [Roseiflexaceae bacterium]
MQVLLLRVRALAEERNMNMSQLQKRSGLTMPTIRRYWYNTKDGKSEGASMEEVNIAVLEAIARVLGVRAMDLFEIVEEGAASEGNSRRTALAA